MVTSIVLADDHRMVRQCLSERIEKEPDLSIVGETGTGLRALDLAQRIEPDVLIVDIGMPGLNGLEVTRRVKKRYPKMRVVVLTMHSDEDYLRKAMRNGADAYVLKEANVPELVKAIHEVMDGRRYITSSLCPNGINDFMRRLKRNGDQDAYDSLTNREREVLQLLAEGMTNKEIAEELDIGKRTVETHRANLMDKLDAHSEAELTRYAIEHAALQ